MMFQKFRPQHEPFHIPHVDAGLLLIQEKFKADNRYYSRKRDWMGRLRELQSEERKNAREAIHRCVPRLEAMGLRAEQEIEHISDYMMYLWETAQRNKKAGFAEERPLLPFKEWLAVHLFEPWHLVVGNLTGFMLPPPKKPVVEFFGDDGSFTIWVE